MWRLLGFLQRRLTWVIPACMVAGLVCGRLVDASPLKAVILPLTFLMVYPMLVNLQVEKVLSLRHLGCQVAAQVLNFGVIPFLALLLGRLFFPGDPLAALGLLLAALLPTSGMTISWTGFAGGNLDAAVKMTVVGLILGSLATPLYASWLMGEAVPIPLERVFLQVGIVVFLPLLAGVATRRLLVASLGRERYAATLKGRFPLLSTVGVLGIVFVAMALKANTILGDPVALLWTLAPLVILYLVNFAVSTLVGRWLFERGEAIALVYGTVMRNLSIALAIAMTAFGERGADIAVIIAIAYIIQVQAGAWYVRFTDRVFGPTGS